VLMLCGFSVLAKLTAMPLLLLLPFIYFGIIRFSKNKFTLVKLMLIAGLMLVPWLARNYILSGYFLFPVPGTDFLHPDWQVPKSVINLHHFFAKYTPIAELSKYSYTDLVKMNRVQLLETWFTYLWNNFPLGAFIFLAALLSPLYWILVYLLTGNIHRKPFLLWSIFYASVCIWFINSPELRFGLAYLLLATAIPIFEMQQRLAANVKTYPAIFLVIASVVPLYYSFIAIKRKDKNGLSLKNCLVRPALDKRYSYFNDKASFPFVNLGHSIKLYLPDNTHECLNADGPCMYYPYGQIALRGDTITDGFRNVKDEVKEYFPYLNNSH